MGDFGYSKRGREVNEAQADVHAAFKEVVDRNDTSDPRTQRWLRAIEAWRAAYGRVYPDTLRQVDQGAKRAAEIDTGDMLDFLEADPVFDRSGYMKEKLLTELKRRKLDQHEVERFQAIILNVVQEHDHRREFRRYCRAAANVDDDRFRTKLSGLEQSGDPHVAQRANWVLAALDGKWHDLKRAARAMRGAAIPTSWCPTHASRNVRSPPHGGRTAHPVEMHNVNMGYAMSAGDGVGENRYIAPGTKVRSEAYWNDDKHLTSEFGIVVHCWLDDEIGMFDCYIAFFGNGFPTGKPDEAPYILRYAAVGLVEVSG